MAEVDKAAAPWQADLLQALYVIRDSGRRNEGVGALIVLGWREADRVLREHWESVVAVSEALLQQGTVSAAELKSIARMHGVPMLGHAPLRRSLDSSKIPFSI